MLPWPAGEKRCRCCCFSCIPPGFVVEGTTRTSGDIGVRPRDRSCCGCRRTTAPLPLTAAAVPAAAPAPPPAPAAALTSTPPPLPGTQFAPGSTGSVSVVVVFVEGEGSAETEERGTLPPAAAAAAAEEEDRPPLFALLLPFPPLPLPLPPASVPPTPAAPFALARAVASAFLLSVEFQWFLIALSVLPGNRGAMRAQAFPHAACFSSKIWSSSGDHSLLLISGLRWLCHRSRHCLPMRPGSCAAINDQRLAPCLPTSVTIATSSSWVHCPLTKSGLRTFCQRWRHWTSVRSSK